MKKGAGRVMRTFLNASKSSQNSFLPSGDVSKHLFVPRNNVVFEIGDLVGEGVPSEKGRFHNAWEVRIGAPNSFHSKGFVSKGPLGSEIN